jgi:hypothetical protein
VAMDAAASSELPQLALPASPGDLASSGMDVPASTPGLLEPPLAEASPPSRPPPSRTRGSGSPPLPPRAEDPVLPPVPRLAPASLARPPWAAASLTEPSAPARSVVTPHPAFARASAATHAAAQWRDRFSTVASVRSSDSIGKVACPPRVASRRDRQLDEEPIRCSPWTHRVGRARDACADTG